MKTQLNMDKIAAALGAKRSGKVSAGGGYFGAMQLLAEIEARFLVPAGGGRATDPRWTERRLVPLARRPKLDADLLEHQQPIRRGSRRPAHLEPLLDALVHRTVVFVMRQSTVGFRALRGDFVCFMLPKFQRSTPEKAANAKPGFGIRVTIAFAYRVSSGICEDYHRKLKTLGLVDGHQLHSVGVLLKERCFASLFCSRLVV